MSDCPDYLAYLLYTGLTQNALKKFTIVTDSIRSFPWIPDLFLCWLVTLMTPPPIKFQLRPCLPLGPNDSIYFVTICFFQFSKRFNENVVQREALIFICTFGRLIY